MKQQSKTMIGHSQIHVYLSGPMRGLPGFNYPAFHEVEKAWLAEHPDDIVFNPARNYDGKTDLPIETYMQADLEQVLAAQVIVLLPDWEQSEGASQYEVPVARITGKIFYRASRVEVADWNGEAAGHRWEFECISPPGTSGGAVVNDLRAQAGLPPLSFVTDEPIQAGDELLADWERGLLTRADKSERAKLLDEAKRLVTGDRNNSYGPPTQDFERSANALNAYGYRGPDGRALKAHDIAIMVMAVKISRLMWTPAKRDSWVDIAGYAACGIECAIEEDKPSGICPDCGQDRLEAGQKICDICFVDNR